MVAVAVAVAVAVGAYNDRFPLGNIGKHQRVRTSLEGSDVQGEHSIQRPEGETDRAHNSGRVERDNAFPREVSQRQRIVGGACDLKRGGSFRATKQRRTKRVQTNGPRCLQPHVEREARQSRVHSRNPINDDLFDGGWRH